jgi:hypothetical protein
MGAAATAPARPRGTRERRLPARREPGRLFEPGRATLDDRVTALWGRLVESGTADCPVCGAEIAAGRPCGGCGSELS